MFLLLLVLVAGLWAGVQNALAGGGSFVTLPALILSGMSPLAANITSTVALFPGQIMAGWAGRKMVRGAGDLSFRAISLISIVGGALGGLLLLKTPSDMFTRFVPWLVLFATALFAWGSFHRQGKASLHLGRFGTAFSQFLIAIYGGYFGGGIGILMLAALAMAGLPTRFAGATKNALSGVINAAAVLLFLLSPDLRWLEAVVLGAGALAGGFFGAWLLLRVNEKALRVGIICLGIALAIGLFLRPL